VGPQSRPPVTPERAFRGIARDDRSAHAVDRVETLLAVVGDTVTVEPGLEALPEQ
jgi:hypothetical protein